MILRLFRGRAPSERADDVAEALAGRFLDAARVTPGLSSFAAGLRVDSDAVRFVLASTWDTFDELRRRTHGRVERPVSPLLDFMTEEGVDHYELVGEPIPVMVAPPDAIVRLASMTIRAGREEEFYLVVRRRLPEVTPGSALRAYHLGRRIVDDRHRAVAVSVWRSVNALGELVDPGTDTPLWAEDIEPLIEDFQVEHFDAVLVRPT